MIPGLIRPADNSDVTEIVAMIRELAAYERAADLVEATEEHVAELLFGGSPDVESATHHGRPAAYCHVVEHPDPDTGDQLGAFALWFLNTSTWTGRHGIYLEDLYVRPGLRGRGYGKALLATLASLCVTHGYRRLEWWVLDWNEPALGFYRSIGAQPMDEWTVHRLTGDALAALAEQAPGSSGSPAATADPGTTPPPADTGPPGLAADR